MDALQRSVPDLAVVEVCGSGLHQGFLNQYMEDFAWILVPGACLRDLGRPLAVIASKKNVRSHFRSRQMLWDSLGMLLLQGSSCTNDSARDWTAAAGVSHCFAQT